MISNVNIWAVLIASVASMIIGMAWYSRILFGKQWMTLMGMSEDQVKADCKKMTKPMIIHFISNLILFFALGRVIFLTTTISLSGSVALAILLWLGFVAASSVGAVVWEKKSWTLFFINTSYQLASFIVAGLIFAWFN